MKTGDRIYGYAVKRVENLKELDSVLIQLEHEVTGAKHIHIKNKDKENTFAVLFRTVPEDSTGVAHILEHTVLCGSRKFNVKDPFFSMLKRGLSTFMNAFTSSDWTMYPFSTQNLKDYYNLADVYLDATFFPKLDELSFKQEGHRLELVKNETSEELVYKVDWSFVYLGTVTMSNLGQEFVNGKEAYHIQVVIESNPFLHLRKYK